MMLTIELPPDIEAGLLAGASARARHFPLFAKHRMQA
jgi:hypothetical protein